MSPNYMPSPEGLCPSPPRPEGWCACHEPLAVKTQGTEKAPFSRDRGKWPLVSLLPGTEFTASAQRSHLTRNLNSDSNQSLQASFHGETELHKEPFFLHN